MAQRAWRMAVAAAAGLAAAMAVGGPARAAGDLIVRFAPGDAAAARTAAAGVGQVMEVDPALGALRLRTPMPALARDALTGRPGVRAVAADVRRALLAEPLDRLDPVLGRSLGWGPDAVDAPRARALEPGRVRVAVLDSGVDAGHPDLAGQVVAARDFTGSGSAGDVVGHGTMVAGLMAAGEQGVGIAGVAAGAEIVSAKVVRPDGGVSDLDAAQAVSWAADQGARVINLSFGGPAPDSPELTAALADAARRGVVVVAAAGNDPALGVVWPARGLVGDDGRPVTGLAVGAATPSGAPAGFSARGPGLSVLAPGAGAGADCRDGVVGPSSSAVPPDFDPCRYRVTEGGAAWETAQGTSFAAPFAAGAAALAAAARPGLDARQVALAVVRGARGPGTWSPDLGWGEADAAGAVEAARTLDTAAPALSAVPTATGSGLLVAVDAPDAQGPGERPAPGPVAATLAWSADGVTFTADAPVAAGRAGTIPWPGTGRLWVRVRACDANANCAAQALGPLGPPAPAPDRGAATAPAPPPRARARLLVACRRRGARVVVAARLRNAPRGLRLTLTAGRGPVVAAVGAVPRVLRVPAAPGAGRVRATARGRGLVLRAACRVPAAPRRRG